MVKNINWKELTCQSSSSCSNSRCSWDACPSSVLSLLWSHLHHWPLRRRCPPAPSELGPLWFVSLSSPWSRRSSSHKWSKFHTLGTQRSAIHSTKPCSDSSRTLYPAALLGPMHRPSKQEGLHFMHSALSDFHMSFSRAESSCPDFPGFALVSDQARQPTSPS